MKNLPLLITLMVLTAISIIFSALSLCPIKHSQLFTLNNSNINVSQVFQDLPSVQNLTLVSTTLCDQYFFFLTGYKGISLTNGQSSESFTYPAYNTSLEELYKQASPLITLVNGTTISTTTTSLAVLSDEYKNESLEYNTFQVIVSFALGLSFDTLTCFFTAYALIYHFDKDTIEATATFMATLIGFKSFILLVFLISGYVNMRGDLTELLKETGITIKSGVMVYVLSGIVFVVTLIQLTFILCLMNMNEVEQGDEVAKKKLANSVENVVKFTDTEASSTTEDSKEKIQESKDKPEDV